MTLTVTQEVTQLNLTVGYNDEVITLSPVVNTLQGEYVKIQGFNVLATGKSNLSAFQVNDKFHGWNGNQFVRGVILSVPVVLPDDLNDITKVALVINNTV